MKNKLDLHLHTNHSDGSLSPKELVILAKKNGLKTIAITDHDTVFGLKKGIACSKEFGITLIPGVEIGIKNEGERGLTEIHILGYFIDYENKKLLSVLEKINESKRKWLARQIKILNDIGLEVSADAVKETAGLATPSRPHIWRILEKNNGNKISRDEFFNRTKIGGDLFVRKDFELPLEDCINLIHESGGIAVLAHPGFHNFEKAIPICVDAGIDGLETEYSYGFGEGEDEKVIRHINELAEKCGLLKTGGSDFHDISHGAMIGSVRVPYEWLEMMKKKIK